ncbi:MAG: hypothetical protein IJV41_13330 [Oscillospiraceae bacterium]|nr:hypothetical protein [Oscillospiraceae bacterium]
MRRILALLLALVMVFALCACSGSSGQGSAGTADAKKATVPTKAWELPSGTQMFKPYSVVENKLGTLTVIDAGFAKKAQTIFTINTRTVNGETTEFKNIGYYSAKDGDALFAFTGILYNGTDDTLQLDEIHPTISYGAGEPIKLYGYANVSFSTPEAKSLEPGVDVEVVFYCVIPADVYVGEANLLLELAGGTLGFEKAEIMSYESIGFNSTDWVKAGDITKLVDEERAAREAEKNEAPHVDELTVEDVQLAYDNKNQQYRINVKVRNINYPEFEGRNISTVHVGFRFLDQNGDAIPANRSDIGGFEGLKIGQAGWGPYSMTGGGTIYLIDRAAVDTANSIAFDSYEIWSTPDAGGISKHIKGVISEPPVFLIDDILPNRADAQALSDSDAISVENATVEFMDTLPSSVRNNSSYSAGLSRFSYALKDSETYAAISFSVTNLTKQEITIADMGKDFIVELNYDDGFIYSTQSNAVHFVQSGKDLAVINHNGGSSTRIGEEISLSPLVSTEVTVYLSCAKVVSTQIDKSLVVTFRTTQTGNKQIDVMIR